MVKKVYTDIANTFWCFLSSLSSLNMRTLLVVAAVMIAVSNAILEPIFKRIKDKHPNLFSNEDSTKYKYKLGGVPNITLCTPNGVKPELTWNSYSIKPADIVPNEQIYVSANATLSDTVTDGNVNANIAIGSLNILNEDLPLCEILPYVGLECPVPAGPIIINEVEVLPEIPYTPSSLFNVTVSITDQNGNLITCVDVLTTLN